MTLLDHEIDYIAERLARKIGEHLALHITERLDGSLRAMEKEIKRMTDQAVTDVSLAVDNVLGTLGSVVAALQTDAAALAAALANSGAANDVTLEALAKKLNDGAAAAAAVLSTVVPASPAPAPAAAAPAPAAAPATPAATA